MSALDYFVGIATPKLEVPHEFKPTLDGRGWVIWPFNENPWWSAIIAAAPALLGTILIFMDQQITAVIVNRKENKLKVSFIKRVYLEKILNLVFSFFFCRKAVVITWIFLYLRFSLKFVPFWDYHGSSQQQSYP